MDDIRICVAYQVEAKRKNGNDAAAHCLSTYHSLSQENWRVIQHQQRRRWSVA